MSTKRTPPDGLRITNQYRSLHGGMMYEFECQGAKLDLHVSPRKNASDAGDWRIEARKGHAEEGAAVVEWAATRSLALQQVGRAWASQPVERGLPRFDWELMAQALTAVRAL
jgi:hypothetical protein